MLWPEGQVISPFHNGLLVSGPSFLHCEWKEWKHVFLSNVLMDLAPVWVTISTWLLSAYLCCRIDV